MSVFWESFVFGLGSSLHCAGMCGPLAACFRGGGAAFAAYHGARALGYGAAGALAGSVGGAVGAPANLGAVTPLLPCGVLYAVYAAALAAGSWHAGATTMLGFALGSVPLLLLAQVHLARIRARLGPRGARRLQAGVMLAAAGVLAWRGAATLGGAACCG